MKEATCENCEFCSSPSDFCYHKGRYVAKQDWCCGFIRKEEKEMKSIHIEDLSTYSVNDLKRLHEDLTDLIKQKENENYLKAVEQILDAIQTMAELGYENEFAIDTGSEAYSWAEIAGMINTEATNRHR